MAICHSVIVQTHSLYKVNVMNVNYGLGVIMMWQCGFKRATLMGTAENGGGRASGGAGGMWQISVLCMHFAMNLKLL